MIIGVWERFFISVVEDVLECLGKWSLFLENKSYVVEMSLVLFNRVRDF